MLKFFLRVTICFWLSKLSAYSPLASAAFETVANCQNIETIQWDFLKPPVLIDGGKACFVKPGKSRSLSYQPEPLVSLIWLSSWQSSDPGVSLDISGDSGILPGLVWPYPGNNITKTLIKRELVPGAMLQQQKNSLDLMPEYVWNNRPYLKNPGYVSPVMAVSMRDFTARLIIPPEYSPDDTSQDLNRFYNQIYNRIITILLEAFLSLTDAETLLRTLKEFEGNHSVCWPGGDGSEESQENYNSPCSCGCLEPLTIVQNHELHLFSESEPLAEKSVEAKRNLLQLLLKKLWQAKGIGNAAGVLHNKVMLIEFDLSQMESFKGELAGQLVGKELVPVIREWLNEHFHNHRQEVQDAGASSLVQKFWLMNGKRSGYQGGRKVPNGQKSVQGKALSSDFSEQDTHQADTAVSQRAAVQGTQQITSGGKTPDDDPPATPAHTRDSNCPLCRGGCKEKTPKAFAGESNSGEILTDSRSMSDPDIVIGSEKETEKNDVKDQSSPPAESLLEGDVTQYEYSKKDKLLYYRSLSFEELLDLFLNIPVDEFLLMEKTRKQEHLKKLAKVKGAEEEKKAARAKLFMAVHLLLENNKELARKKIIEAQEDALKVEVDLSHYIIDWMVMYHFKKMLEKIKEEGQKGDIDKFHKYDLINSLYQSMDENNISTLPVMSIEKRNFYHFLLSEPGSLENHELLHLKVLFHYGLIPVTDFEWYVNYDLAFYFFMKLKALPVEEMSPVSFTEFDKIKIMGVSDNCLSGIVQSYKALAKIPKLNTYFWPALLMDLDRTLIQEKIFHFFCWIDYESFYIFLDIIKDFVELNNDFLCDTVDKKELERIRENVKRCLHTYSHKLGLLPWTSFLKYIGAIIILSDNTNNMKDRTRYVKAGTTFLEIAEYYPQNLDQAMRCYRKAKLYPQAAEAAQQLSRFFSHQGNTFWQQYWADKSDELFSYNQSETTVAEETRNPEDLERLLASLSLGASAKTDSRAKLSVKKRAAKKRAAKKGKGRKEKSQRGTQKQKQQVDSHEQENSHEQEVPVSLSRRDEKDIIMVKGCYDETSLPQKRDDYLLSSPVEPQPDISLCESSGWKTQKTKRTSSSYKKFLSQYYHPDVRRALCQILASRQEGDISQEDTALALLDNPGSNGYTGIEHLWSEKARTVLNRNRIFITDKAPFARLGTSREKVISQLQNVKDKFLFPALASYLELGSPDLATVPEQVEESVQRLLTSPQCTVPALRTAVQNRLGYVTRSLGNSYNMEAILSRDGKSDMFRGASQKWYGLALRTDPIHDGQLLPKPQYKRLYFGFCYNEGGRFKNNKSELLSKQVKYRSASASREAEQCWEDPYTGGIVTDRGQMSIDHIVPLKWAWNHDADKWEYEKRRQFANDESNLVAVQAKVNEEKGDSSVLDWKPKANTHWYVKSWKEIIEKYGLTLSGHERQEFEKLTSEYIDDSIQTPTSNLPSFSAAGKINSPPKRTN